MTIPSDVAEGSYSGTVIISGASGKKKDKDKKKDEADWMKKIGGFFGQKAGTETKIDGKDIEAMIPKDVMEKIANFIKENAEK